LGLLGWVVFAIPNVIGAASVGWWLKHREQAADFTLRHATAISVFTSVTLLLQGFTAAWLVTRLLGNGYGLVAVVAVVALSWIGSKVASALPALAVLTWLASATAGVTLWSLSVTPLPAVGELRAGDLFALLGLAGVCGIGFLICPFLDASLLSARVAAGERGRRVFTIGFGVLFLTMIVITLGYANVLPALMQVGAGEDPMVATRDMPQTLTEAGVYVAGYVIAVHLLIQVSFTNACHLSSIERLAASARRPGLASPMNVLALAAAAIFGWVVGFRIVTPEEASISISNLSLLSYEPGEIVYRILLAFYGVIFPAYLLLGGRRWLVVAGVALVPTAVGFFGGSMAWALIGVAIILLTRLVSAERPGDPSPPLPPDGPTASPR
jgi:hypothetical protein